VTNFKRSTKLYRLAMSYNRGLDRDKDGIACARRREGEFPLGDSLELFIRREDAERFIEEVQSDEPELAAYLRIEERELEAGGRN
jgi:hypothetical protein